MKSIRFVFLIWLLPCIFILQIIAGIALYQYKKYSLEADLKFSLVKWTSNAKGVSNRSYKFNQKNPAKIILPYLGHFYEFPSHLNPKNNNEKLKYFQVTTLNKEVIHSSENLLFKIKTPPNLTKSHIMHRFVHNNEKYIAASVAIVHKENPIVYLTFAINKKLIDPKLDAFINKLIAFSLLSFIFITSLVLVIFHFALNPIKRLENYAQSLTVNSLDQSIDAKKLPIELKPIALKLNELMSNIHLSLDREKQFSNDVAHELRTPLAEIRSTSEVAVLWPDKQPINDFNAIKGIAIQMQSLVDGLMMLSRFESQSYSIEKHPVDIKKIVIQSIDQNKYIIKSKNIKIDYISCYDQDIKSDFISNTTLLNIIISNLINNAVSHCEHNSIIEIHSRSDQFIFFISNLAPNLDKGDEEKIFNRLWKKDKSRSDSNHNGIGLSIVLRCIKILNLNIETNLDHNNFLSFKIN